MLKADLGWVEGNPPGDRATALTALEASIGSVLTVANGKNRFYRQTTAPTDVPAGTLVIGDLWADSDDNNRLYRWTAGTPNIWVETTDARIGPMEVLVDSHSLSLIDIANYVGDYTAGASQSLDTRVTAAYDLADDKSKVYRQNDPPAGTAEVPLRAGDLWFDINDGNKPYGWSGTAWVLIDDARITTLSTAYTKVSAGTTAGDMSSATFFMTAGGTPAAGFDARIAMEVKKPGSSTIVPAGLYIDMKTDGTTQISVNADSIVFTNGALYTKAFEFVSGVLRLKNVIVGSTNIEENAITTGKLNANAVTAGKIDAGAVTTDKLSAGAVTAGKIDAGAVTTDKLSAGAVTATKIEAGAVTASKISVANLKAISATLGDVDISAADITNLTVKRANIENLAINGAKVDLDAITTTKVAARQIETHETIALAATYNKNGSGTSTATPGTRTIVNQNPSAVIIEFRYDIDVSLFMGQPVTNGATASLTLRLKSVGGGTIYTANISVSSTPEGSSGYHVGGSRQKSDAVFLVDVYASTADRTYTVEAEYSVSGLGAAVGVATFHVVDSYVNLMWIKR